MTRRLTWMSRRVIDIRGRSASPPERFANTGSGDNPDRLLASMDRRPLQVVLF